MFRRNVVFMPSSVLEDNGNVFPAACGPFASQSQSVFKGHGVKNQLAMAAAAALLAPEPCGLIQTERKPAVPPVRPLQANLQDSH